MTPNTHPEGDAPNQSSSSGAGDGCERMREANAQEIAHNLRHVHNAPNTAAWLERALLKPTAPDSGESEGERVREAAARLCDEAADADREKARGYQRPRGGFSTMERKFLDRAAAATDLASAIRSMPVGDALRAKAQSK